MHTLRWTARACLAAGVAGAAANALTLAYLVLLLARPGDTASLLGPLAGVFAGFSALLLVPVAMALGSSSVAAVGVVGMVVLAGTWWAVAARVLALAAAAPLVAVAALLLAGWLWLVCREPSVPPRAGRLGRRLGAAAMAGTLIVGLALLGLESGSAVQVAALVVGGIPAGLAWLAVPAWSIRMARWLRSPAPRA